jgi:hypothetical protein
MFHVAPQFQPLMRVVGLDADAVFTHEKIVAWRKLPDRENCTLDAEIDGKPVRLHIKRYLVPSTGVDDEVRAIDLLHAAGIESVPLVGWGKLADGRSFLITEDLAGYRDAEKLVREGMPFDLVSDATSELAAKLHEAGLHHRDLYLCHFFVRVRGERSADVDVRLIDVARVAPMRSFLTRWRWVVKDLAQFWYSTTQIASITDADRDHWLERYAQRRKICWLARLRSAVKAKSRSIARHDAKLKETQPARNISIPTSPSA